jgi:glycosyltransferase involved in cell wall biosynthesis
MTIKKKIFFISPSGYGGIQTWCCMLGNELGQYGFDVTVVWMQDKAYPLYNTAITNHIKQINIYGGKFVNQSWLLNKIAATIKDADIIYPNTTALVYKALSILKNKKPLVVSVCHSLDNHDLNSISTNIEACDAVILLSDAMKGEIQKRIHPDYYGKLHTIRHGLKKNYGEIEKNYDCTLNLLFSGRLDNNKRPELSVEITKILRDNGIKVKLNIAGEGPLIQKLKQLIKIYQLEDTVELLGFLSKQNLIEKLNDSHFILLLSKTEGFGLSALEGMQYGSVPIVTETSGIKEIICHGKNGFIIDEANIINKTEEIISLLDKDRTKLIAISNEAQKTINDQYLLDNIVRKHISLFTKNSHNKKNIIEKMPGILDNLLIPNWVTYFIRYTKHKLKNKQERL